MQIESDRETDDVRNFRLHGFRQGIGFEPSSIEADQRMEMTLEFDDKDDDPERLEDEDLDTEQTWPSKDRSRG